MNVAISKSMYNRYLWKKIFIKTVLKKTDSLLPWRAPLNSDFLTIE